jgi:hypothetical protein
MIGMVLACRSTQAVTNPIPAAIKAVYAAADFE